MPTSEDQRTLLTAIDPEALAEARDAVPDEAVLIGVVGAFRALADSTRARILYGLTRGPLCVRDLAILVGVSESAISHQLRFLREQRLDKTDRRGKVIATALVDLHIGVLFREAEYHADHVRRHLADHPYP